MLQMRYNRRRNRAATLEHEGELWRGAKRHSAPDGGPSPGRRRVRERSLRGEDALVWLDGLHTDHEQVEDHRYLRDC